MARNITPRWKDGWRVVGPGGGGAQFCPTISPHDDRDMFICCDMSGFYQSRDAGESFLQMSFAISEKEGKIRFFRKDSVCLAKSNKKEATLL